MIVEMEKYTFLVYHKEYTAFLEKLREIGVVHVAHKPGGVPDDEALRTNLQLVARLKSVLKILEKRIVENQQFEKAEAADGMQVLEKVEGYLQEQEKLSQQRLVLEKEIERMTPWGSFSWERIHQLEDQGLEIRFYGCVSSKFQEEWKTQYHALEVASVNSMLYFITITAGESFELDADLLRLSPKNVVQLQEELSLLKEDYQKIDQSVTDCVKFIESIKATQHKVFESVDMRRVELNTTAEADNSVMILQGYAPTEDSGILKEKMKEDGIFYLAEKPLKEDHHVPVKLKNSKFIKPFEFIGSLYELPNYHKTDLTPYFGPFYAFFFGFCFADAAYGMLLAGVGIYFYSRVRKEMQQVMRLLIYLGVSAFVMGIVTGNFGGIELYDIKTASHWYKAVENLMLTPVKLFYASLIVGAIQVIFGQFVRAISRMKTDGFSHTISTWGWLIVVLGSVGILGLQKGGMISPEQAKIPYYIVFGIGGVCIFILNHPGHNILINIGEGLWDTYEKATGWLGDVLSYIRLFAISVAGAVLAIVFNSLATTMSGSTPVVSQLAMILILLFGHSINIFMAILSSFVHPLRLTFVEFYKNAGFVGGGKSYKPFARYKEEFKLL
ncbi:V-type ATP synthase subunit I [Microbacter margulisiae]|uniref:V/A-type H+-transporting ATPase subunit I n=1 Tax=Microbacter margulisiae TaxID=1350067 RepID=A0A7W5DTW1_9PORP|nr:V-type ATPase 116kDa subunit family protein [Microbacter margulisiae]MBB3188610.1 V/A-type H+-transporting ATPase subunit I [Microbacter margulisiae]